MKPLMNADNNLRDGIGEGIVRKIRKIFAVAILISSFPRVLATGQRLLHRTHTPRPEGYV
jgi:hypothetical protein